MGRTPCCSKEGLNRGAWSALEDKILSDYIKLHGEGNWRSLPKKAGLKRCGKSCRLRWLNYLRPGIKRGNISSDEEDLIIRLHNLLGNRWSLIAGRLPGRTDNEIKNYWNTTLGKKVGGKSSKLSHMNNPKQPAIEPSADLPQTQVVRTKAFRCTKLFVTPSDHKTDNLDKNAEGNPIVVDDLAAEETMKFDSGELPEWPGKEDGFLNSSTDFNVREPFLSNVFDSDFLQLSSGAIQEDKNTMWGDVHEISSTQSDCIKQNFSFDLRSLASFLDSEVEFWGE